MSRQEQKSFNTIRQEIFRSQIFLILIMAGLITVAGIFLNLYYEGKRVDQNLQNVAETIAHAQVIQDAVKEEDEMLSGQIVKPYLDSLKESLSNIDVISVIGADKIRYYHSNPDYIATVYDGTIPEFIRGEREFYSDSDRGPSGKQRRAYAAIYDENGAYLGFVMAVMLQQNIMKTTLHMVEIYLLAALAVSGCAVLTSFRLSRKIKDRLMGYEPDTFSAMFKIRDNILESLEEGILAIDNGEKIVFINHAAAQMLGIKQPDPVGRRLSEVSSSSSLSRILQTGRHEFNVRLKLEEADIISDRMPVTENGKITGAVAIYRNRTEYTKLVEDLTGVRYMVESMRASNHDFTNKLHVILGLIQMEQYQEAVGYIMNVTLVERETIHHIMQCIEEPSVAALLIGKHARASELNIRFVLKNGSSFSGRDVSIPSGTLVTLIGNLLDNAMDSMNEKSEGPKELTIGIFTQPHTMIITVDDTGKGMTKEIEAHIYEYGFSTKGEGRGTGMYLVKSLVDSCDGTISAESEPGTGTSFTITLKG